MLTIAQSQAIEGPPRRVCDWKTIAIVLVMAGLFFYLGLSVGITIGRRVQTQGEVHREPIDR